jgi:hypothetical protein
VFEWFASFIQRKLCNLVSAINGYSLFSSNPRLLVLTFELTIESRLSLRNSYLLSLCLNLTLIYRLLL